MQYTNYPGYDQNPECVPARDDSFPQSDSQNGPHDRGTGPKTGEGEELPSFIINPAYPAVDDRHSWATHTASTGPGFTTTTSCTSGYDLAHFPLHAASQQYGGGGHLLAPQQAAGASFSVSSSSLHYADLPPVHLSSNVLDPRLLSVPSRLDSAFLAPLDAAGTGAGTFETPATSPFHFGTFIHAPAPLHPGMTVGIPSVPQNGEEAMEPWQNFAALRSEVTQKAQNHTAPPQTATQASALPTSGLFDAPSAAVCYSSFPFPVPGDPAGLNSIWTAGSAQTAVSYPDTSIESVVSTPSASVSGVIIAPASAPCAEGAQQAASKRKRVVQSKAAAVPGPETNTSGAPRDSAEKQPRKKRVRGSIKTVVPLEFMHEFVVSAPAEQLLATTSACAGIVSYSSSATSDSGALQPTAAAAGPVWHSAAPGVDLSGPPALTGPDDPDGDIQPAPEGTKYPPQGATLKLCKLPWEAGTVVVWEDIPLERQLRAVRRFRLRFPWASWETAEAYISLKCRKQRSEKERQEDRKANRKAARAARISDGLSSTAGPSAGSASYSGALSVLSGSPASVAASPSPVAATVVDSGVPSNASVYGSNCANAGPSSFTLFAHASVPSVVWNADAAVNQGLAFTGFGSDPRVCATDAATGAAQPLFLPFDEDEEDRLNNWPDCLPQPQDFYAAATADPIVNRLDQMNDRDHQAARNLGLNLVATDVGAIHPFATSTAVVPAPDAGVDALDQQRGLGDVREADTF
ncbi:hypothetical protein BZA77DRAFT_371806 [Pyronema omphalodes]|nr:hypothetical protein BZA77DRAFT_371806 [Pyronema omphalodes]